MNFCWVSHLQSLIAHENVENLENKTARLLEATTDPKVALDIEIERYACVPSGERLHSNGKFPIYSWENPLFLWPFSIAMLVHQRVYIIKYNQYTKKTTSVSPTVARLIILDHT